MKIEFKTSNAAFDEYGDADVARILEEIVHKVRLGYDHGAIIDINGNKVGFWKM